MEREQGEVWEKVGRILMEGSKRLNKDWGRLREVWEKVCKQDCRLEREKACSVRRWLTWAFVGRRWEALPQPHVLNAKQHCYCVRRAAAAAWTSRLSGN